MSGVSPAVRDIVIVRARGYCERCGYGNTATQIHHRRPRAMGGSKRHDTNTASNLGLLCVACHRTVEADRAQAYEDGWLVHQGHSPSAVPVCRRGVFVWLNDDGTFDAVQKIQQGGLNV